MMAARVNTDCLRLLPERLWLTPDLWEPTVAKCFLFPPLVDESRATLARSLNELVLQAGDIVICFWLLRWCCF